MTTNSAGINEETFTAVGSDAQLVIDGRLVCFNTWRSRTVWAKTDDSAESICGGRFPNGGRRSRGPIQPAFDIELMPTPAEWDTIWLPLLSFDGTGGSPRPIVADQPSFDVKFKTSAWDIRLYPDCRIERAVIRGQKGTRPVSLTLSVLSLTPADIETLDPQPLLGGQPYPFTGGFTGILDTFGRQLDRFALIFDYGLEALTNNKLGPDMIRHNFTTGALATTTPSGQKDAELNDKLRDTADGITGSVTISRGGSSLKFDFPELDSNARVPSILDRGEIRYEHYFNLYRPADGSAAMCTATSTVA